MVKSVFSSHAELAHAWASGSYTEGKSSDRRMFFDGPVLYSYGYHFVLGALYTDFKGHPTAIFSSDGYSISTSKHMGLAQRAVSHMLRPIAIKQSHLNRFAAMVKAHGQMMQAWPATARSNLEHLFIDVQRAIDEQAAQLALKAKRARVWRDAYEGQALGLLHGLANLSMAWGCEKAHIVNKALDALALDLEKHQAERKAREKAEREGRALAYKANRERPEVQEAIMAWRSNHPAPRVVDKQGNERDAISYWRSNEGHTLLRRSLDGLHVQTSQGASVPWLDALKLYTFAKRALGKGYQPPPNVMCGAFRLTSIDKEGNVKIGCHDLLMPEMDLLARAEGVAIG